MDFCIRFFLILRNSQLINERLKIVELFFFLKKEAALYVPYTHTSYFLQAFMVSIVYNPIYKAR